MMFSIKNAGFWYKPEREIFRDVTFSLERGKILCILGPNGIGKSTLLKCCGNILPVRTGEVRMDGKEIEHWSRRELAQKVGYVPQAHTIVFPFSVLQLVLLGRTPHIAEYSRPGQKDIKIAEEALKSVGIEHLRDAPVNRISGGECQLAMIARALAQEPSILILDEPTNHLDFGNQIRILHILNKLAKERSISIIMSTHYPDHTFLLSCQVGIMTNGIVSLVGHAEDVVTEDSLEKTYQISIGIHFIEPAKRNVCVPSYP
ncbi:ABC transporter ATP-binding protein [Methanospirillum sp. J.3.6.1-F.2.7.3]|jgi:iron complex transport system ATP-binding protein|uniref:Cobalamin import ATP-binding protein BtuD n=2 Tax=Methanospirillum TaxID=2202 RepID=A0A8E7EJJ2_9EURY|nr:MULTISPECIES: ABC transporter ATP-binding protein [Methanospirillum]MDX8548817.1 ABC transporter ATP-binding protein [Methanospirillum hungatei]QVV88515.1 ABC transporter ATP-binding protein [Methanospirillum sp. J.3.6.1-F.2.7.3]QXO94114.1 ABC transporter ATP-binding protein [Methanospirillum hungatei]